MEREECYAIICDINEECYMNCYEDWCEADDLESELLREKASEKQTAMFRKYFKQIDEETQQQIKYFVETDRDFRDDFESWYGERML